MEKRDEGGGAIEIPVDTASLTPSPPWATGDARKEERQWDHLEVTRRQNDRRWLETYGRILVFGTNLFAFVLFCAVFIWAWHQLAPEWWGWLSKEQLGDIKGTLFNGGMGAIIFGVLRAQINKAR
ncbi:MAG: hypothetical protein Q4D91_01010 [Lautropia sp.]|nr:hypothetical protein [Lautropia sp.]